MGVIAPTTLPAFEPSRVVRYFDLAPSMFISVHPWSMQKVSIRYSAQVQ